MFENCVAVQEKEMRFSNDLHMLSCSKAQPLGSVACKF